MTTIYLCAGFAFFLFATWLFIGVHWKKVNQPDRHGNFPQATQALAGIMFGASSLWVAYSVKELQLNASADAALDRVATLIERVHEDSARQKRELEADDPTATT